LARLAGCSDANSPLCPTVSRRKAYLQSKRPMLRLDRDVALNAAFSDPEMTRSSGLHPDVVKREAYKFYKTTSKSAYDPTPKKKRGEKKMIRMEVSPPIRSRH